MVDKNITYAVDPDGTFGRSLRDAATKIGDLTIPFNLIVRDWYQGNKAIFALAGPGKYQDLSDGYKVTKKRKWDFLYPILKASGRIEDSITNPASSDTIATVVDKTNLDLGTKVEYAIYHQSLEPRSKMPFRPMLFIGAEQTAPAGIANVRVQNWTKIVESYVSQVWKGG